MPEGEARPLETGLARPRTNTPPALAEQRKRAAG
jgi:hypothetical protein